MKCASCPKRVYGLLNNVANIFGSHDIQLPTDQQNNICISQNKDKVDFGGEGVKSQVKATTEAHLQEMF